MPATADTTMIALALATGRSLARKSKGFGSGGAVLTLLRENAKQFDDGLEALKRIEDTPRVDHLALEEAIVSVLNEMLQHQALVSLEDFTTFATKTSPRRRSVKIGGELDLNIFVSLLRDRLREAAGRG